LGASRAQLVVERPRSGDATLFFGWRDAPAAVADFGDPLRSATYAVCVYDGSGAAQPLLEADALSGGRCTSGPCWKPLGKRGFRYTDSGRRGLTEVRLAAGNLTVRGIGAGVAPPGMPLESPVTVQLVNSDTDACWQAEFAAPARSTATVFRAR
jgi:hypothetical protein